MYNAEHLPRKVYIAANVKKQGQKAKKSGTISIKKNTDVYLAEMYLKEMTRVRGVRLVRRKTEYGIKGTTETKK